MKTRALAVILILAATFAFAQATDPAGTLRVPDAAQFVGQPKGTPLSGEALEHRTNEVGSLLRCPVCQGMAVSDSPAEMAVNMKAQVRELLARGYTEEQILKYFELSYGQFVLLRPKFEGFIGVVWILPLVGLAIGATVLYVKYRNLGKAPVAAPAPVESSTIDEPEDPYVARVRELVSGGK